jgi:hypothetical protein
VNKYVLTTGDIIHDNTGRTMDYFISSLSLRIRPKLVSPTFIMGNFQIHHPAGILEYKCFFYVILYVIILFDIEIDIKIGFIFCVETVFL